MQKYPEKVRQFTHPIEFDYVDWTFKAIGEKFVQSAVRVEDYLSTGGASRSVREYLRTQREIQRLEVEIAVLFANPDEIAKEEKAVSIRRNLEQFKSYKAQLAPIAESVLQDQISQVLSESGLSTLGQPFPPVLYHSTPLPMALIVSPREKIQQDANISLLTEMTAEDKTRLEDEVMKNLNVSSLVVPIGGVGVYPTMVMATSDLEFLTETVAHEWVHNFLTLRPLGINYETTPELRTINETTASIAGTEIGKLVMQKYYPDLLPPEPVDEAAIPAAGNSVIPNDELDPEPFNYRKEMHTTRLRVDDLLAQGRIIEAENYMEQRRNFFWENGYAIRRLNQAYFAFYGAYADTPGGAAGKDPVGPVVRAYRKQTGSLEAFLKQISWITRFDQLKSSVTIPVEE